MLPALATGRLALRPCAAGDAPDLLALFAAPGVRRFLFDGAAPTGAEVAATLACWAALARSGLGGWTLRPLGAPAGSPLGCAALRPVGAAARFAPRLAGQVEPVLALAEPHWGRGLAREALSALVSHAFGTLRLPGLVAVADAPNARSIRMLLAAGFAPDGEAPGPAHPLRLFRLDAPPAAAPPRAPADAARRAARG
jgi:RimJ/RimL family protein N-acetyltransferase